MRWSPRFRRLAPDDLPRLHEWLGREHVRRWWTDRETYDDVVARYLPAIEGRDPTDVYVVLSEDRPVGFIQTYLVSDYPEYAALVGVGDGVAGVDLFVAEESLLGRGLGSAILRVFTRDVVFARPGTVACVADPDVRNAASIRAFEKAGFRTVREFVDPADGERHALVRLDRDPVGLRLSSKP